MDDPNGFVTWPLYTHFGGILNCQENQTTNPFETGSTFTGANISSCTMVRGADDGIWKSISLQLKLLIHWQGIKLFKHRTPLFWYMAIWETEHWTLLSKYCQHGNFPLFNYIVAYTVKASTAKILIFEISTLACTPPSKRMYTCY